MVGDDGVKHELNRLGIREFGTDTQVFIGGHDEEKDIWIFFHHHCGKRNCYFVLKWYRFLSVSCSLIYVKYRFKKNY